MVDTVTITKKDDVIVSNFRENIIKHYIEEPNCSLIVREYGISRNRLLKILKDAGVYDPSGYNARRARSKSIKQAIVDKYGVVNVGQLESQKKALFARNNLDKTTIIFHAEFKHFSELVDYYTNKNKKNMTDTGYCFYTGIKFRDSKGSVNPNDPLKRTLDHKMSKLEGFFRGVSPEVIGGVSNLLYCLRYCNSVKGNMDMASFAAFSVFIRERLKNEGHESN